MKNVGVTHSQAVCCAVLLGCLEVYCIQHGLHGAVVQDPCSEVIRPYMGQSLRLDCVYMMLLPFSLMPLPRITTVLWTYIYTQTYLTLDFAYI